MNRIFAVLLFFNFLFLYKFERIKLGIKLRKWRVYAEFERPISYYLCRVLVRIRFDGALSVWSACTVNIGAVCIPLGLRMGWGDDDSWISLVLDRRKQSRLNVSLISLWSFVHAGWVPSIHWGPSTIREVFLVHVVQPTSRQEALLQEARKTDESRRGTSVQGGASGEWIFHFPLFVSSWYNGVAKSWVDAMFD